MTRIASLIISFMLLFQASAYQLWNSRPVKRLSAPAVQTNQLTSSNINLLGQYDTPGTAYKVFVQGNDVFLVDTPEWNGSKYINAGLRVMDVTNPGNIIQKGSYSVEEYPKDIWVDGAYGFFTGGYNTRILSLMDPTNISEIASFQNSGAYGVAKRGNYVYVGNGMSFQVIDVSNPQQPLKSETPYTWFANEIAIDGSFAYVAAWSDGLVIMSLTNPKQPVVVRTIKLDSTARDVAIEGKYAYIAARDSGLYIFDITNPANAQQVGNIRFPGIATGVDVENGIAYVSMDDPYENWDYGLRVVNVVNPKLPYELGYYKTSDTVNDVVVSNKIAYLANAKTGLTVLQFVGTLEPFALQGPTEGYPQYSNTFTARFSRTDLSGQLKYVWTASEQQPVTHTSPNLLDQVSFTWTSTGKKTVTVKVLDAAAKVIETKSLDITISNIKEFTVNHTDDAVDTALGDGICETETGNCSLRAAVQEANALPDLNKIIVPAGNYVLTLAGSEEDKNLTGDLDFLAPVILTGEDAENTIIDGNATDRVLDIIKGPFSLHDMTIQNGSALDGGGIQVRGTIEQQPVLIENSAILNNISTGVNGGGGVFHIGVPLTISNTLISGNYAKIDQSGSGTGGGILSVGSSSLIDKPNLNLDRVTIIDNHGDSYAAGLLASCNTVLIRKSTFRNNMAPNNITGGAIAQGCPQGKMRILDSSIDHNQAGDGAGVSFDGERLEITNTTIAYNTGGAIYAQNAFLRNVTVAMNTGSESHALRGKFSLDHTLIANNSPANCYEHSEIVTKGYNLSSDLSCKLNQSTDGQEVNAELDAFGDHGGPTHTFSLRSNSPAVDAGSSTCINTDQRGLQRPVDGNGDGIAACDIGALEHFVLEITLNNANALESLNPDGITYAEFVISTTPAAVFPFDVEYETADGSALAGVDYESTQGTVTFLRGESIKKIQVPVYGDLISDTDEEFFITVRIGTSANSDIQSLQATATIHETTQTIFMPGLYRP